MDDVLLTLTRGGIDECFHRGHVAIWKDGTGLIAGWGDPHALILPRSSCKMMQAVPLVESGAAARAGLGLDQLALACASHNGAAIHTDRVGTWLTDMGMAEDDLLCGTQYPDDHEARKNLTLSGEHAGRCHNNCSGKHAGFLQLTKDIGAGRDYVAIDHPVQLAVRASFEELTDQTSPGYGIDGCSAPNFATQLSGLARAMAQFASQRDGARGKAMGQLYEAMVTHPDLVAGETRACTRIMRACKGRAAVKTGAEGVFVGIVPELGIGIALKISDGATRASEAIIAAILGRLGILDPTSPEHLGYTMGPIRNRAGLITGDMRVHPDIANWTP